MKIYIKDISFEGIEVVGTVASNLIDERLDDDLKFVKPIEVTANVEKIENEIVVQVTTSGSYSSTCSRCLENVEANWQKRFVLDFEVEKNTDFIELDEDIRQEIFVGLPSRILCTKTCKGLCPDCGVNLNKEECKKDSKKK